VPRPIRVAIDLRPLARGPSTGIGLILTQILSELPPRGFEFVGVGDRSAGGRIRWERGPLPRLLRALDPAPDLFHATWNHGVPAGLPFPSVLSLHDLIPWTSPQWVPWPRPAFLHRLLYRRAVRASAARAVRVVTLSEASRREIEARLPESGPKIDVVPCAVPRWFHPASEEEGAAARARFGGDYVLYFGGFDPRKGVEVLVDAVAQAFPDRSRAPALVLAGAVNAIAESLARSAEERGLRAHVPGYVPDRELPALLRGARLFVYPSRQEGFGIPPLLALAAGTPCVTSDAAAVREVVGDAALLFSSGDASALARILAAPRDPEAEAARALRGRERAARFSVDAMAERMTRVYERAAGTRAGSG
jgi:alpha-1,3-rhamnosyl/mannosyltransferase